MFLCWITGIEVLINKEKILQPIKALKSSHWYLTHKFIITLEHFKLQLLFLDMNRTICLFLYVQLLDHACLLIL